MIKIHLKKDSTYSTLDEVSEEYYKLIEKKIFKKANEIFDIYKFFTSNFKPDFSKINAKTLVKLVNIFTGLETNKNDEKINTVKLKKQFANKNKTKLSISFKNNAIKSFFPELLKFFQGESISGYTLEQIIICTPNIIESISKFLNKYFEQIIDKPCVKKIVNSILNYSEIHTDDEIRKLYLNNFSMNSCPYCNRNYISYIEHDNEKVIGPTLDHFLAKSIHPFLTASFYNLIPSCYVCNSNLKGKKETKIANHINPYIEGFGNVAKFILVKKTSTYSAVLEIDYTNPLSSKIKPKPKLNKNKIDKNKDKGNVNLFKLNEIYEHGHNDDIEFIVKKCDYLNGYYKGSISKILSRGHGSFAEFYEFYFHNFFADGLHNRKPLSKLTKDLAFERWPWLF